MRFSFANAFDLGRVQRIDLFAPLVLSLLAHREGQRKRLGSDAPQAATAFDFAHEVAADAAETGADPRA